MSHTRTRWDKESALAYVRAIEVPGRSPVLRQLAKGQPAKADTDPGQPGVYINEGMIISVSQNLSGDEARYVQDCTLLASLAAKKKLNSFSQPQEWYQLYFEVLTQCGWFGTGSGFSDYQAQGSTVIVNKAVLEVISGILSASEIVAIRSALDALENLADSDGRIVLWDHASHSTKAANFQVASASKSGNDILLKMGAYYFFTTQGTTKFLWMTFSSSNIEFHKKNDNIQLDLNAFQALKDVVKDKVISILPDHIKAIEI
jgi:hypothetical protein